MWISRVTFFHEKITLCAGLVGSELNDIFHLKGRFDIHSYGDIMMSI